MRKKAKNRSKSTGVSDSIVKQKLKEYLMPIQLYLNQIPAVIAVKKLRDRTGQKLLQIILGFFALLSPCWSFFFIRKSPKKNDDTGQDTK